FSTTGTFASSPGLPRSLTCFLEVYLQGGQRAFIETGRRRVSGDFLAGFRRVWKCSICCSFSAIGYRFLWRGPCLWLNGADDGLRYWAHFGLPLESSCVLRSGCRQAFSGFVIVA